MDQRFVEQHVRHATAATAVSQGLASIVSEWQETVQPILTGLIRLPEQPEFSPPEGAPFRISHTGNLYSARRTPEPLFKAIREIKKRESVQFRVSFFGTDSHHLDPILRHYATDLDVVTEGFISHAESLRIQQESHVNLLLTWNHPATTSTITGKVFEYIQAGRPILHIGNPDNEAAKLLEKAAAGVTLNDPHEIGLFIDSVKNGSWNPPESASLAPYTYKHQGQILVDLVKRIAVNGSV